MIARMAIGKSSTRVSKSYQSQPRDNIKVSFGTRVMIIKILPLFVGTLNQPQLFRSSYPPFWESGSNVSGLLSIVCNFPVILILDPYLQFGRLSYGTQLVAVGAFAWSSFSFSNHLIKSFFSSLIHLLYTTHFFNSCSAYSFLHRRSSIRFLHSFHHGPPTELQLSPSWNEQQQRNSQRNYQHNRYSTPLTFARLWVTAGPY